MNNDYMKRRFSHLLSYAGIGSIIRDNNKFFTTLKDIKSWIISDDLEIKHTKRIRDSLGINKKLIFPPTGDINNKGELIGTYLQSTIFPKSCFCKKCGLIYQNPFKDNQELKCKCGGNLEQIPHCQVSSNGYMDDVLWHNVAHQNNDGNCKRDLQNAYLKFNNHEQTPTITCKKCGSSGKIDSYFPKYFSKIQPWISQSKKLDDKQKAQILSINDSRIYIPKKTAALVIPPESRISKNDLREMILNNEELYKKLIINKIKFRPEIYMHKFKCTKDELINAINDIKNGYPDYGKDFTKLDLLKEEYKALTTKFDDMDDSEDFVTKHYTDDFKKLSDIEDAKFLVKIVSNLVSVKKLREIVIFNGFYRIEADIKENLVKPDIDGSSKYLPAIELFGEGIFFSLDERFLKIWEENSTIKNRTSEFKKRINDSHNSAFENVVIEPRFLLLHTLSHLIIKELVINSGYPEASLKERIYSSKINNMAGILIYTSVADEIGTLGGIEQNAKPENFIKLLNKALQRALWCSMDPVCSEQTGQGVAWLNMAACHACVLTSEVSCSYSNLCLDRIFIKGNDRGVPILSFIQNNLKADVRNSEIGDGMEVVIMDSSIKKFRRFNRKFNIKKYIFRRYYYLITKFIF
ncbi:DUF1998 domain-containing protein [Campylobacter sp. FMV-PI01]|uniref:DUF1998 domain-containing protein n=1 Tax=Campylobacter portucalensis TaxID=2608384 RepID=A0A6L5WIC6_9BACT|nr:DUF1998 domain-containing protein [Campylobacter portucalensis]MSN97028.1 DUF1998 domain-containing protein [Campylobacter portucalensis]